MAACRRLFARLFPLVFASLVATPALTADADVREWVEALDNAQIRGAGIDAAGKTYKVGNFEVRFTGGRLLPVVALDRVVGMFFTGEGEFSYVSADPLEHANFATNVRRATRLQLQESRLGDAVGDVVFWDPTRAEAFPGADGWPEGEPSAEHAASFRKTRKRCSNDWGLSPELYLAQVLLLPPPSPPAIVQIGSSKHDLLYRYDTLRYQEEEIYSLDRIDDIGYQTYKGLRLHEILSSQPIGRSRLDLSPTRFRLVNADAELVNIEDEDAELTIHETFQILTPTAVLDLGLTSLRLSNREHHYKLDSVTVADGAAVPFVHRRHNLLVQLPRTMKAGETVTLTFKTDGDILYRPDGDSYWLLGTSDWLPLPNRMDMQLFSYRAVVKTPKAFTPFSGGETVRRWEEEGKLSCAEFKEENPIMFPVILAGKYKLYEKKHEDLTIQVASYAHMKSNRMEGIAENLLALMEFYAKILGEYPYRELKVLEINEWGFGQAPPGIIFITKEAFMTGSRTRGWSVGINARLAHELAHTWWGDVSPWASSQDQWLSESTADYYAAVAMGILWRESKFEDIVQEWVQNSNDVKDHSSLLLANQLSGDGAFRDRWQLLYNKGPLVLHALRQEMGDNAFFSAFKTLLSNRKYQHLTTKDVVSVLNYVTKEDYTGFADRYILGTEMPDIKELKGKKKKGR
jgi:hypothetical protein